MLPMCYGYGVGMSKGFADLANNNVFVVKG